MTIRAIARPGRAVAVSLLAAAALSGCAAHPFSTAGVVPAEGRVSFDAARIDSGMVSGDADRAAHRRLTADDPVRIASISKLVVALGVMRLVERGTLDLDRDVSDWLGYRLRNPAFPDTPITLRLLLSHRSSLTDATDYVVPFGVLLRDRLADPKAWDGDHAPGTYFRYTNFNFPVIASVMERATGTRFDRLMATEVLRPLGIDACYNWGDGCSDATVARAVVLYNPDGSVARDDLHGVRPDCPVLLAPGRSCDLAAYVPGDNGGLFSPQGGLRISLNGLARVGQMLLRRGEGFLSPASIALLEGPEWRFDGSNGDTERGFNCRYGLAMQTLASPQPGCNDDLFGEARAGTAHVGHSGDAYGLRSGLWIDRNSGRGVAFFATAIPDGVRGRTAFTPQEERLATGR